MATLAWCAMYLYIALGLVAIGIDSAIHFNGPSIDGPFQLHNPLRRIAHGQRVGVDFQFFHGAGVPYLHYPVFRLLGGDFFASELARQLVSTALFGASFFIVFFAWTRSYGSAARLSLAAVLLVIISRSDALFFPQHSLLGVRSTMPLILAAVLVAPIRDRTRSVAAGVVTGLGLALGTEQGMAMVAALGVAAGVKGLAARVPREAVTSFALTAAVAAASYAAAVTSVAGFGGMVAAAEFNFRTVPREQFWFFGGPPNRFLFRWDQLVGVSTMGVRIAIIAAAVLFTCTRLWRFRSRLDRFLLAESYLAAYALFSTASILGTLVSVYLQPAVRISIILFLLALYRLGSERSARTDLLRERYPALLRWREPVAVALIAAAALIARKPSIDLTLRSPLHLLATHTGEVSQELSAPWRTQLEVGRRVLAAAPSQTAGGAKLWSTYSTIVESDAELLHPSFDYLIHALGPANQADYLRTFLETRPSVVQTVKPTHTIYEEWLESNHWGFYREILRSYAVADASDWSFFWVRRDAPVDEAAVIVAEGPLGPEQQDGIALRVDELPDRFTLLEIRLRYRIENPWRRVPIGGGLPRYVVAIEGAANRTPLSLSPYETERTFPVVVLGPSMVYLRFTTQSLLPGPRFVVDSAQVTRLAVSPENEQWLRDFAANRGGASSPY